jgi:Spy/CpxP family protein refolding chaperone
MKTALLALLFAAVLPVSASHADAATDPFAGAFYPPEMILMAHEEIGMTPEQLQTFRGLVEKAQPRSEELRKTLEAETAALGRIAQQERVDEKVILTQLDKVLDLERELKHLHIGLEVGIKNLLTPEQQAKLRELAKNGGTQLAETARKRLTAKVESVQEGTQRWAAAGRDPSAIGQAMEEKVKPLLDSGKIIEAEAELDRLLEQLKADSK